MSEVTVTILDRDYRLAVSSGEEELLKDCARQVDEQMQTVRAAGRVIANDQIAVLTALEFAYESKKREEEAKDGNAGASPAPTPDAAQPAPAAQPAQASEDAEALKEIRALCRLCEEALYRDVKIGTIGSLF